MKSSTIVLVIVIVVLIGLGGWFAYQSGPPVYQPGPSSTSTGTGAANQSISDGLIKLTFSGAEFGLAVNPQQVLVQSVIPPCDQNFNYCIYYTATSTYVGTTFESAGIRIKKRLDLATRAACLMTQPSGFTGLKPTIATSTDYAVSVFPNVGQGAAGSFANGVVSRLYYAPASGQAACYEFESRVAESNFGNYPSGTVRQFTDADRAAMKSKLQSVLATLTIIPTGEQVVFPQ